MPNDKDQSNQPLLVETIHLLSPSNLIKNLTTSPARALQDRSFLPNFCTNQVTFLTVVLGESFAFILTLAKLEADFWSELALTSLFVQWATLSSALLLCCCHRWLNQCGTITTIITTLALTETVTLIFSVLGNWFLGPYFKSDPLVISPYTATVRNLAIAGIITLIALRYFYIQHQWQRNIEAEARARLQALQARIHPHFLFNTLNTIASLIRSQPDPAEQAVLDLADLLRSALTDRVSASLAEEIELTRRYLAIERLRIGERLQVDWRLDDGLPLDTPLPPLLLQPLVENAIRHGIQRLPAGGILAIHVERQTRALHVTITNPRPPEPAKPGHGTAQANIRQRLQLAYALPDLLCISETPDHYQARITIPLMVSPTV